MLICDCMRVLNKKFFERDTVTVARELLGKMLVRKIGGKKLCVIITEVEVYDGFRDRASHASRGKTKRNEPMFGDAGHWYVYFTYGMHWMLNIVTREREYPAAVLIRGSVTKDGKILNGPAKLTKFLGIDGKLNSKRADEKSGLWIATPERRASLRKTGAGRIKIKSSSRVGVKFAGPYWSRRKWRFYIETHSD